MENYQGPLPAISESEAKDIAVRYASGLPLSRPVQVEGAMLTTDAVSGRLQWYVCFSFAEELDGEVIDLLDLFGIRVDAITGEPSHTMSL